MAVRVQPWYSADQTPPCSQNSNSIGIGLSGPFPFHRGHARLARARAGLGPLGAVLRPPLAALLDPLTVERATDNVVTHAGEVLHAAAADQHHRVLLQVVALARNVGGDLIPVGQAHAG